MFYFEASPAGEAMEGSVERSTEIANLVQKLGRKGVLEGWAKSTARELARPADGYDPAYMAAILPWMERFSRYFAAEVRGLANLPAGPVLLVGNHSGGALTPDTSALYTAWYRT